MKKLEKILVIWTLALGGSLLSYGLAKEKQVLTGARLLCLGYPAGIASRTLIEKDDREYFKRYDRDYPRQNISQKGL